MKVGFSNMFSFRPHVEHLFYLSKLLTEAGHEAYYLTCDASVSNCYARAIKGTSKLSECSKCMIGGVRSFTNKRVASVVDQKTTLDDDELNRLALSSSCTLSRTESDAEWNDSDVVAIRESLHAPVGSVFESAKRWITENKLEAVICFNGRMDLTRAVTHACEVIGIPYITHERTWFGDGIQLVPNDNCLALKALGELVKEYDDKPLTSRQAHISAKLIGERFLQKNSLEWRLYNKNPEPAPWPIKNSGKRVLIVPSSRNEFAGHNDWATEWEDNTKALDDFFDVFDIAPEQVVLRCHPNWAENIGQAQGNRSLSLYRKWAKECGVYLIDSEEKASTYDLIQQSDIVILNGGSSSVEAGACGKKVVCLGPSTYQQAGFVQVFYSRNDMEKSELTEVDPDVVRRKTLRFLYVRSHRFPQFVDYVKAVETTRYNYYSGGDANVIVEMLRTGRIPANDSVYAESVEFEDDVIKAMSRGDWGELIECHSEDQVTRRPFYVKRRFAFRWIDGVRAKFSRGDRG